VLKPSEMRGAEGTTTWPPPRDTLCRVTIKLLSVHGLPELGEERPRLQGVHSASHAYVPWLSGSWNGPVACHPLSPFIKFALHPIGGFCSVSTELPPSHIRSEHVTAAVQQNGLRPRFGETIHCLPAEPYDRTVCRRRPGNGVNQVWLSGQPEMDLGSTTCGSPDRAQLAFRPARGDGKVVKEEVRPYEVMPRG